jgi:hypothetical protein
MVDTFLRVIGLEGIRVVMWGAMYLIVGGLLLTAARLVFRPKR